MQRWREPLGAPPRRFRAAPLDVVPGSHRPMIEALRSGDPERAELAAQQHVEYGRNVLLSRSSSLNGRAG